MTRSAWAVAAMAVMAQAALLALLAWTTWDGLTALQRQELATLAQASGTVPLLAVAGVLGLTVVVVRAIFERWITPLRCLAEDARIIATSNPRHRATETAAAEWAHRGVRVNAVAPGEISTERPSAAKWPLSMARK